MDSDTQDGVLTINLAQVAASAFAVDQSGTIVAWNPGAERLLGQRADVVIGLRCRSVIDTRVTGACPRCAAACGREPLPTPTDKRDSTPDAPPLRVTTFVAFDAGGARHTVHLLERTVGAPPAAAWQPASGDQIDGQVRPLSLSVSSSAERATTDLPSMLTKSELRLLQLLARGQSTQAIAETLSIADTTARNHVAHILGKLGVRSRLQAVVRAEQLGLL